ncbi:MAG: hypothetical protein H0W66_07760, partial [Chthoniobacterales bacterium]|nr:hypothetical protein [Chthoniobacterales bacterium]
VEFADFVRAVSRSRTKKGCYFSFGAPFPKQVLSVWVPDEIYYQLPRDPGLLGRKVRIKGRLESSSTGPMVTLASADDFELFEVADAMLSKSFLDARKDRDQFMAAVSQTFWREDFTTLEQLARELDESHERFSDGTWILSAFFQALEVNKDESDERFAEALKKMERWLGSQPASATAVIAQAGYHLDLASHVGAADTPAAQEEFKRETTACRRLLEANPGAKVVPEYFVKMEKVAYDQGWTREAFFRLFDEGIGRERDYYSTYFQAAHFLLHGPRPEKGGWERFAEEQRQARGPGGEGDVLYTRIAWSMSVHWRNLFSNSAVSWETMAAGFDRLMQQYPESRWLKNSYTNFAPT